jgi:ATP-dependent Clp protease ATP-binding subunit ClpC
MNNNKIDYSIELNTVIDYAKDVLLSEFPNKELTIEYILLSILDTRKCHANLIIGSFLVNNHFDNLRNAYHSILEENARPVYKSPSVQMSDRLRKLLEEDVFTEADAYGDKEVGTEHVLMAILNPKNGYSEGDIFNKFAIEYEFIADKCHPTKDKRQVNPKSKAQREMILKSQVNVSAQVSTKGEFMEKYTTNVIDFFSDIENVIGRDDEVSEVIKTLSRKKKNNVVLVGDGGCGKTSIVVKLAHLIRDGEVPSALANKEIIILNTTKLIAGTSLRGMFEERVNGLFNELKNSTKYILFIDDIQNVLKSNSKEKDGDMSGLLTEVLNDSKVRIIATTTFKDYKNCIEINSSLSRKLQKIVVEPNDISESVNILMGVKGDYEKYHNVQYTTDAIRLAVTLADRYITNRSLPDSAIDVIDFAGASMASNSFDSPQITELKGKLETLANQKDAAMSNGNFELVDTIMIEENVINAEIADLRRASNSAQGERIIGDNEIKNAVSELSGIPVRNISGDEKSRIANMDNELKSVVIGQDEAIETICKAIKRNKVGLGDKNKTLGTFLLVGESGCGKTLISKQLAKLIFGSDDALVRIDMSEFSEKNSVAKLTGAAPGYIGFDNGGQLTEAIKHKQHCVLLLDEIEKANQEVFNIFLQLFDEGRLTDSSGQLVNFKNVIVLMTSNVGTKEASSFGNGIGFSTNPEANKHSILEKELKKKFSPEFLNRIDKIVYFNKLTDDNLKEIVKLELDKFKKRMNEIKYDIVYDDDTVQCIHAKAIEQKDMGARPILRLIQDNIEDKVTDLMLSNDYSENYVFSSSCIDNTITIK